MAYPDFSLDSDLKLLIEPNLHGRMLLKKLENEVDGREEDFTSSTSSGTAAHICKWMVEWTEVWGLERAQLRLLVSV